MTAVTPLRIRLKEVRESRDLTQVELATRSGVGRPTISNIETGKTSGIDFDVLERLANALGVNAAVLIEHTSAPKGKRG
jgi:transcriptional regulator with XRE-family HTH domain